MTRVNSGIKFEYLVRDYFKAFGYGVMRAAGSKGAFDLLVWKGDRVIAIQCKKETRKKSYKVDWDRLVGVPVPMMWNRSLWVKRGTIVYVRTDEFVREKELSVKEMNKIIKESQHD